MDQILQQAPMQLSQDDINTALAEQAKTILLQKKQINYLVGALQKLMPTPAADHNHEAPVPEAVEASNAGQN